MFNAPSHSNLYKSQLSSFTKAVKLVHFNWIGVNEFNLTAILALQTAWHPCKEHTKNFVVWDLSVRIVTETHCISTAY